MHSEGSASSLGSPIYRRHDSPTNSRPKQSAAATKQPPAGIDQARTFLQQLYNQRLGSRDYYDLEKPFICRISTLEWFGLCREFDLDGARSERWPRFSYNSVTSTLKIYAMASWLHETVISFINKYFWTTFERALPTHIFDDVQITTGLKMNGFAAEYRDSTKVADIGIFMTNNTRNELRWALEVGFSEKYDDLREDIRLWLIGNPTCSMAVLVNITESPIHQCPLDFDLDLCDELGMPQDGDQMTEEHFTLHGDYGPVEFKGHQWVGQISEVYLEIWTRNPRTGVPRRRGGRISIVPPTNQSPQFQLADFLPIDNPQMTSFNWDVLRTKLKTNILSHALLRYRAWLHESRKCAGVVDDSSHRPL
ncbi:hypothetical protein CLAIMM_15162 [Cladophialophora immunda]|nr:hypothetical protein CLAIMM_15162 [Cladophialophora immunda]